MPVRTIILLATSAAFLATASLSAGTATESSMQSRQSQLGVVQLAQQDAASVTAADQDIVAEIAARLGVESVSSAQLGALYRVTVLRQEEGSDAVKSALGEAATKLLFPNGEFNHAAAATIRNLILRLSAGYRDRLATEPG